MPIEITRFEKSNGPLTKRLHLGADGKLCNDSKNCSMSRGTMFRERLPDLEAFASLIENLPRNEAIALGALIDDLPGQIALVTADGELTSDGAARTKKNIAYKEGIEALVLCDYDTKGMPPAVAERIEELSGFVAALTKILPELPEAGLVLRQSTSACAFHGETGENLSLGRGLHLFVHVEDGSDAKRFLYDLHDRCWLKGLGWFVVDKVGKLQEKSIIDRMVCGAERLVFEAAPDLDPPIRQRRREAIVNKGVPLDTREALLPLSEADKGALKRLKAAAFTPEMKAECAAKQKLYDDNYVAAAVKGGAYEGDARRQVAALHKGVLHPAVVLNFVDKEVGKVTVGDVLKDPAKYGLLMWFWRGMAGLT